MAGSVNKVIILGNLGANPELKYLPSGQPVCEMRVATSEVFKDKNDQRQERTEWHRIVVWGKTGENCAKYLTKGQQVYLEGRLQTRSWDDKDGNKRYSTEIVADQVVFLRGGGAGTNVPQPEEMGGRAAPAMSGGYGGSYGGGGTSYGQGYGSAGRSYSSRTPPRQTGSPGEVPPEELGNAGDDDIPF
jgi:single-strand DNA-binding protein